MGSASNGIPGGIRERRDMRQQMEAMVRQLEAPPAGSVSEATVEFGKNGGAGKAMEPTDQQRSVQQAVQTAASSGDRPASGSLGEAM